MSRNRLLPIMAIAACVAGINGETVLRNGAGYSGCEDTYLSALYAEAALTTIIADSLTNHSADPTLNLTH